MGEMCGDRPPFLSISANCKAHLEIPNPVNTGKSRASSKVWWTSTLIRRGCLHRAWRLETSHLAYHCIETILFEFQVFFVHDPPRYCNYKIKMSLQTRRVSVNQGTTTFVCNPLVSVKHVFYRFNRHGHIDNSAQRAFVP
jgi:hypothetical protein